MKIQAEIKEIPEKLMAYEEVLKSIYKVFGITQSDCKFGELSICGIVCNIANLEIKSFTVSYDKICFDIDGKSFHWPIQKHSHEVSLDEGHQILEQLKRK